MSQADLPASLRRFLLGAVGSVPHLEALLLLRGEPETDWSAHQVAQRLFITEQRAGGILTELRQQRLIVEPQSDRYRYGAPDEGKRAIVDQLAQYYSRHLVEVTGLLHAKLEAQALEFSDAFRLRKEP